MADSDRVRVSLAHVDTRTHTQALTKQRLGAETDLFWTAQRIHSEGMEAHDFLMVTLVEHTLPRRNFSFFWDSNVHT